MTVASSPPLSALADWRRWPERLGRVTNSHSYVPQIDGLRFLAIMQVVAYHAALRAQRSADRAAMPWDGWFAFLPNGVAGVELFFFISGYIIAYPFMTGHAPRLRSFYMRRVTRLEPPYILTVTLCCAAFVAAGGNVGPSPALRHIAEATPLWQSFAASLVYLHGLIFAASPRFNPPLWTLEIEIQFYILAPAIILAYLSLRTPTVRACVGVTAIMAALVLQAVLDPIASWHYSLLAHLFPFLLGIAVCDWASHTRPFERPPTAWADITLAIGLALFFASSTLFYVNFDTDGRALVLAVRASGILMLYLGAARGNIGRRLFGNRWIALVGGACYSIYLLHVPLLQVVTSILLKPFDLTGQPLLALVAVYVIVVPIVIASCMAFYAAVERPCMNRDWPRRLWSRVAGRSAGA
ncbi:acyltransferase family protein [Sphingomonas sp. 35-24ZXX]|uniref:acyltransferase family protein n=1 Tax=Sphingomonas sp. 35-24ZXX TaxID=1545915 RepID=UPI0009DDA7FD|nr:acyltransferase [Sphingomonas sp. 35-24ZXX]